MKTLRKLAALIIFVLMMASVMLMENVASVKAQTITQPTAGPLPAGTTPNTTDCSRCISKCHTQPCRHQPATLGKHVDYTRNTSTTTIHQSIRNSNHKTRRN